MSAGQESITDLGLNELELATRRSKTVDFFSIVLVGSVFVAIPLSVYFYREAFNGGLSAVPDRWSAFGSYIGGVFGPLVSFLTLLAILKTIGLQKELLDTQRHEFKAMQKLQAKTLGSQLAQIERASAEADRRVVEETRLNVLKTLDNYSAALRREYEVKRRGFEQFFQWVMDKKAAPNSDQIEGMLSKLSGYEKRLASLTMLYSDLCFDEFADVASIKACYKSGMEKIWAECSVDTADDVRPRQD